MKHMEKLLLLMLMGWSGGASAAECVGLIQLRSQFASQQALADRVVSAYAGPAQGLPSCTSSRSVLAKMLGNVKRGGTRLEEEKPYDPIAARANLQQALSDPAIKNRLTELKGEVKDEDTRLFLEAAIFDEEGFYEARELKIRELQQRLQ